MNTVVAVVGAAVAYLVGTFPSAPLVARANGLDITRVGSGNPGASNIARVLGWRKGIWVFVLDAAKGAIAAGLGLLVDGRPLAYVLAGAAIVGHVFPIGRGFRGGKGVATGGGAFAVISPVVFPVLILIWLVVSRLTRMAALASILAVAALPVGVALVGREPWEVPATIALCGLVMIRHLGNIKRIVTRRENRL
ncbi:MAG: glycerol-3-phosphate 1-O-acyltransferase PlsY [Ilumatobacteraceae bacterium]